MASPFSALSGRKRDAEAAMLDVSSAPAGSLQAEVLAAAAVPQQLQQHIEQETRTGTAAVGKAAASRRGGATAGPLVTPLETLIPVPELETTVFDSWEAFHAALAAYGERTHQLYSVRSATPAARRNQLLAKKRPAGDAAQQGGKSQDRPEEQLIPERFHHYVKTITCTHGGKPRHRSTGARPNHHHRAIQCPAQINACVKRDAAGWRVHVTNQHAWHNHEVSAALYKSYPEVRNALGADVLATVNILRKAEAKRKKILEYIVEHSPQQPRMKDVHNLLSKLKRDDDRQRKAKQP